MEPLNENGTSALICIAQEVADKRQQILNDMNAYLLSGQNKEALGKARELCGIYETSSTVGATE